MELMGDPEMTETIQFVRFFDRFFDCLNVSSLSEGRHLQKPDLYPYQTPNDKRFTVCAVVVGLLPYSGKFSLGANFRDFRGQTCFRENKNRKKCTKMEIVTSLRAYVITN